MAEIITIASKGKPCDPPNVEGVAFTHLEDDVWIGDATPEQAEILTRLPNMSVYGGAKGKAEPAQQPLAQDQAPDQAQANAPGQDASPSGAPADGASQEDAASGKAKKNGK